MKQLWLILCIMVGFTANVLTTQAQLRDVYVPQVGFCFYGVHAIDSLRAVVCGDKGKIVRTESFFRTWSIVETGTTATLRSVDFFSPATGIICGDSGLILRTTNGGMSWTRHTSGVLNQLNSLVCLSSSVAVCVGNEGVLLRSTDAGQTWNTVTSPTPIGLRACAFSPEGVGVAVGFFGTMLRTTDIGQTWQTLPSVTKQSLFSVTWAGVSTCVAGGDSAMVLRSTDAGATWNERQYLYPDQYKFFATHRTNVISFRDSLNGIIAGQFAGDFKPNSPIEQRLYKTTNGGANWVFNTPTDFVKPNEDTIFSAPEYYSYFDMEFITPERGIMVGTISGLVAGIGFTTDGGTSWRMVQNVEPNLDITVNTEFPELSDVRFSVLRGLIFKNEREGCLLSARGLAWTTNDGGRSLQNMRTLTKQTLTTWSGANAIMFASDTGLVGVSNDYGATWKIRNITSLGSAKRCIGGIVRKLSQGKLLAYFYGIQANNTADMTYLLESNDDGDTWYRTTNVPTEWLDTTKSITIADVGASSETQLWATHRERVSQTMWQSILWSSVDGGKTWKKIDLSSQLIPNDELSNITFSSPLLGIISGRNTRTTTDTSLRGMFYLKTTDGGTTWTRYSFRTIPGWHEFTKFTTDITRFYGRENTLLALVNSGSSIMYSLSSDAGATWKEINYVWQDTLGHLTRTNLPQTVWFFNPNHAIIGLHDMGLVEWRSDGITSVDRRVELQGESHEHRIRVYPLPVSKTMNVQVRSLGTSSLTASLLDLNGRVSIPSIEPSIASNSDEVSFALDCSNVSSGMYILSISDGTRSYLRTILVAK